MCETDTAVGFLQDAGAIIGPHLEAEERGDAPAPMGQAEARSLPVGLPARGLGEEAALGLLRRLVDATPTTSGPRFVNQLFAGRERVATAAEIASAALNTSMYTFKAAGPQVLVERAVIEKMLEKAGMAGGDGMFTPGGSLSNLAAMIVARNEAVPGARDRGFDGRRRTVYVSAESHYSIPKNANMIGIGRGNVRKVAADEAGRMRPDALRRAIAADRSSGADPMMIIATSGTTVMGAFDPLPPLADIAEAEGVWLHADGAFGGTALLCEETAGLLEGLGRADSFTWDAHKAMGVPLTCSVALTREPGMMEKHFSETATYLFQAEYDEQAWMNPGTKSLQCGRRNDALKLWAQWQAMGDDGYAARVARQRALANHAADSVRARDGLTLSCDPAWLTVCFEAEGRKTEAICDALEQSGELKIGYGLVHGRRVIRLVTVNPRHTEADLDRMLDDVERAADSAPGGDNAVEDREEGAAWPGNH